MRIDQFIEEFVDDLASSAIKNWCSIFEIPYEELTNENDLRNKITEAMKKIGRTK